MAAEARDPLPRKQRIKGKIRRLDGTSMGGLSSQGWLREFTVSTLQIRVEFWRPTSGFPMPNRRNHPADSSRRHS